MKAYHIFYHIDEDGLASAAVIYEYLKRINKDYSKIKFFFNEIDYTVDLRTIICNDVPAGDEMYFVDYSFSNEDNLKFILDLSNKGIKVTWIDHHKASYDFINNTDNKTMLKKYSNFNYFINIDVCAAYLCYMYAYIDLNKIYTISLFDLVGWPIHYIPLYIKYVDSYDMWKFNMNNTEEFNIGARSIKRSPKNLFSMIFNYNSTAIKKLFSADKKDNKIVDDYMIKYINSVIERGAIIKPYQDINNQSMCQKYGFSFNIVDHTVNKVYNCFALNKRGNSAMFGDLINEYDILVPFQFNGDKYIYSLYTNKDIDCNDLAIKFGSIDKLGGGGHKKASGFQTYNQIIKSNCTVHINSKIFRKDKYNIFTV